MQTHDEVTREIVELAPSPSRLVEDYLTGRRQPDQPGKPVTIRLYPRTLDAAADLAKELGVPRGQLLRELLEGAIADAMWHLDAITKKEGNQC